MQEPCSTLAGVGQFGHRFSAFWLSSVFPCFCREMAEAIDPDEENTMVDVPEREDLVSTVSRERTSDESGTWAERVTQA